jgi:K+-transporting ATPase KdpF subunit
LRRNAVNAESIIMLLVSAGLMVYLLYALLRPEKF